MLTLTPRNATGIIVASKPNIDACDPNARTAKGETALHLSAIRGDERVCETLLSERCPAEAITLEEKAALHLAAEMGERGRYTRERGCRNVERRTEIDVRECRLTLQCTQVQGCFCRCCRQIVASYIPVDAIVPHVENRVDECMGDAIDHNGRAENKFDTRGQEGTE